jgi:cystathionine beta-synthase
MDNTVDSLSSLIQSENKAVLVRDHEQTHIITRQDLLLALTQ